MTLALCKTYSSWFLQFLYGIISSVHQIYKAPSTRFTLVFKGFLFLLNAFFLYRVWWCVFNWNVNNYLLFVSFDIKSFHAEIYISVVFITKIFPSILSKIFADHFNLLVNTE